MCARADDAPWYEGDHLEGGHKFLKRIGHSLEKVWTASAGLDADGNAQVLVIGFNNIELINQSGETILDVGSRGLRALRTTNAPGIEVCTNGFVNADTLQRRWRHQVSSADAEHLEELWLDLPRFNDDGPQLNPLPWREDEYAYYVGRLVTEGARCDVALNGVATLAYSALDYPTKKIDSLQGESGQKLASALTEIGESCSSEALTDLGKRYGAWYEERNLAVHGVRRLGPDGHPTKKVFKLNRKKSQPSVRTTIKDQDFRQLTEIWRAFYALNHDAFQTSLHLGFYNPTSNFESAEQYIGRTPVSSTVEPEVRLPSR